MHLFTVNSTPKKYHTVNEIIDDYFILRTDLYEKRRLYQIKHLESETMFLSAKIRFIKEYMEGTIKIHNKKKSALDSQLIERKFPKVEGTFGYLLNLPIVSLTLEKIKTLQDDYDNKISTLEGLKSTTASRMWKRELELLEF